MPCIILYYLMVNVEYPNFMGFDFKFKINWNVMRRKPSKIQMHLDWAILDIKSRRIYWMVFMIFSPI